jgi:hypothetical protein
VKDLSTRAQRLIELTRQVDGPEASRRARVRAALAGALATGTVSAAAQASLGAAAVGTGAKAAVGGLGWFVAGAALGVAVTVSGQYALGRWTAPRETVPGEVAVPRAAARTVVVPAKQPSTGPSLAPPPAAAMPPARTASAHPPTVVSATLGEEMRLLEQTQVALRSGKPDRALELVREYDRRFGAGALREEAQAARVLALCRAGRVEAGRQAAARFSAEFPGSPLLPRVRRSCPLP